MEKIIKKSIMPKENVDKQKKKKRRIRFGKGL
jgi:hypothetical protein